MALLPMFAFADDTVATMNQSLEPTNAQSGTITLEYRLSPDELREITQRAELAQDNDQRGYHPLNQDWRIGFHADEPPVTDKTWRTEDEVRELAYFALLTVDIGTTLDGATRAGFSESNPIVGLHPTRGRILGAYALSAAGEYFGMRSLPQDLRSIAQWALMFFEGVAVQNNLGLDLQMRF